MGRVHLESLSTPDLVRLADEYGIDIPEGLNRRFIIGELLDAVEENDRQERESSLVTEGDFIIPADVLPETYNETQISVLMRDPGWVFVFWDFHSTLLTAVTANHRFESFFLRVSSLSDDDSRKVVDYFDVDVGVHDRKWYIHLPEGNRAYRVDLFSRNIQEKEQLLAKSTEIVIPPGGAGELTSEPKKRLPPLIELSGLAELRKNHFRNHRQSFT